MSTLPTAKGKYDLARPNFTPTVKPVEAADEPAVITFPDLTAIGKAFTQAISYIDSHKPTNLDAEAREWLTAAGRKTVEGLQEEFKKLHDNRNNPMLLPAYALNPHEFPLTLSTARLPYVLMPYHSQFLDYLRQLLKACGLNAVVSLIGSDDYNFFYMIIRFPEPPKNTGRGLVIDADFQKELFSGLKNLRFGS